MMKLYKLSASTNAIYSPWDPWYDKCFVMVVVAKDATEARLCASRNAAEEGSSAWLSPHFSDCEEIKIDEIDESTVLVRDIYWA